MCLTNGDVNHQILQRGAGCRERIPSLGPKGALGVETCPWWAPSGPHCQDVTGEGGCASAEEPNNMSYKSSSALLSNRQAMHSIEAMPVRGAEVTPQPRGWIYLVQFLKPSLTHSAAAGPAPLRCRAGTEAPPGEGGQRIGEFGVVVGEALLMGSWRYLV